MSGEQYGNQYGGDPHRPAASGPQPPREPANQRPVLIALGAVIVAGLIVFVLAVTGVFSGNGGGGDEVSATDGAKAAVEQVLYASKRQDLDDVKAVVCKKDLDNPALADIVGKDHADTYSIGTAKQDSPDRVTVSVRVTTSEDTDSADLPVLRENGEWKVCFSESGGDTSSSVSTPDPSDSSGTTASPTFNICASRVDAASTARVFISFVTLNQPNSVAQCVADGRLTDTQIRALLGDVYSPSQASGTGPTFTFKSSSGSSTITVTVEQQSDGRYYVTSASKS